MTIWQRSTFQSGRGKNPVLLHAARSVQMVQALYQVQLDFSHIPGSHNELADVLSRTSTSHTMADRAHCLVTDIGLLWVYPNTDILDTVYPLLLCRSGVPAPGCASPAQADQGPSRGEEPKQDIGCHRVAKVLLRNGT